MFFENMSKNEVKKYVEENYSNPNCPFAFSGIKKIQKYIQNTLTKEEISEILLKKESYTLMKQSFDKKKNKVYTPIIAYKYLDNLQGDLIDISTLSQENNQIKFLFCIIDVFTRYAWVFPIENKKSDTILKVLQYFFRLNNVNISNISFDFGGEFRNSKIQKFLKDKNVKVWYSVSPNKCSIVEIFQKYLQRKIYSFLVEKETHRYIDVLTDIVYGYNNSYHSFLKMTPVDATLKENLYHIQKIHFSLFKRFAKKKKPKYSIGTIVRVSLDKKSFFKRRSYNIQNSYQKYEIYKIITKNSIEPKYFLKHISSQEKIDNGYFYENELIPVKNEIFRGNVIKKRKNRKGQNEYLFKFRGYPDRFNQWMRSQDIEEIK